MIDHPLRLYLESICVSVAELASEAGVEASTIHRIVAWRCRPHAATRRRILEALGLDVSEQRRIFPWPPPSSSASDAA